jgi:hypothetical protein
LTISLCLLISCRAFADRSYRERIYTDGDYNGDIRDAIFSQQSASDHFNPGGAIGVLRNFVGAVDNSTFFNNTSVGYGGAVFVGDDICGDVKNSIFSRNSAKWTGGGVHVGKDFYGPDNNFADIGGSKFLSNSSGDSGGGICIQGNSKLAAISGDVIFQGNSPYGIFFMCKRYNYGAKNKYERWSYSSTACLAAFEGNTIYFYDPIASYGYKEYGSRDFSIEMNPQNIHTGTIIFDSARSDLIFRESPYAKISYGVLALHNGASFGATWNGGKLTIGKDATLRVAYEQERREYILNEDESFTENDPSKIIKTYPPYDPNHVSCINAGKVNFDGTVHFVIPQNIRKGDILLQTSSWSSIWGTTVTLEMAAGQTNLKKGDHVVLIRSTWLQGFHKNSTANATYGDRFLKFYLTSNSKELWAVLLEDPRLADADPNLQMQSLTLNFDSSTQGSAPIPLGIVLGGQLLDSSDNGGEEMGPVQNPQNPAFSESYLQGMILVGAGSDLIAGSGMADAIRCAWEKKDSAHPTAFGAFSAGTSRCHTGSHVDTRHATLLAGLSRRMDVATHRLIWGGFLEYGTSTYDTHNEFALAPWVDGDGRSHYLGGGILARSDFHPSGKGHFYLEGSGRMGRLENNWGTNDIRDDGSFRTSYRALTRYRAFHGGGGCILNSAGSSSVDVYGKCFWARRNGIDICLRTDDPIEFNQIESIRLRIGARYFRTGGSRLAPHAGIALEHEFSGKSKAITYGMQIPPPSLGGNNCLGELGISWRLGESRPWTFNFSLGGSIGIQKSVNGNSAIRYAF